MLEVIGLRKPTLLSWMGLLEWTELVSTSLLKWTLVSWMGLPGKTELVLTNL